AFMGFDSDLEDSSENETDLESGHPHKKGPSHLLDSQITYLFLRINYWTGFKCGWIDS
ncbi:Hypothetical protein FKW44_010338, partial [Caligus rogercresseyi]